MERLRDLIVELPHQIVFDEWRRECSRKRRERGADHHWCHFMLKGSFAVEKVKQLVFLDGPTRSSAILRTLKWRRNSRRRRQCRGHRAVAEQSERFSVNRIRPRARGHVDRAR